MEELALAITGKSIARIAIILLLISLAGLQVVEVAKANPAPLDSSGSSNVRITVVSPQNKTYDTNNIELSADFGAFPGVWYMGYSLDGGAYIEIAPGHPLSHELNETVSLSLSQGSHSVQVKATAMANDADGTVIACSKVYFTIAKTQEPLTSPSLTATPASTPTIPEFPAVAVLPLILTLLLVGVAVIVRYRKVKCG